MKHPSLFMQEHVCKKIKGYQKCLLKYLLKVDFQTEYRKNAEGN